jgi:predicted enzyme related to lactoylglutathione lyase
MGHPVTWFQLRGKDGKALATFYEKAFGWKMSPGTAGLMMVAPDEPGGIAGFVDPASNWIGLWQPTAKKPARKSTKRAAARKATKKAEGKAKRR